MRGDRRVVITGIGIVSPIGTNATISWYQALRGTSGVKAITGKDMSEYTTKFWARVGKLDLSMCLEPREIPRTDPYVHFGMCAAKEAIDDSGIDLINPERIGVAVGSAVAGIKLLLDNHTALNKRGPTRVSPVCITAGIVSSLAGLISIKHGLKGPQMSVVSACATGTHNIGMAARTIAYGDADLMVAGGAEALSTDLHLAAFQATRALSKRNDDPTTASRPWDKDRDGLVLGEGAGIVILEEYEHAKRRGATIYAEILGFGMSSDAHHMTVPGKDSMGPTTAMKNAIEDSQRGSYSIDYINAHGTSTVPNDLNETKAIKNVFGVHAEDLVINSTKSMTGHTLGASGAIETIFTALALRHQIVHPTINLRTPGEGCDLDYVPGDARRKHMEYALTNSFGFGGTNASLMLKRI